MNNEIEKYPGELATLREKVYVYESMMHSIQLFSSVTMDGPAIQHMIDIINAWSYAHRAGNGMPTDEEQAEMVDFQFQRIKTAEWCDSVWNSGVETRYKKARDGKA